MKFLRPFLLGLTLMVAAFFAGAALADMPVSIDAPHCAVDLAVQIPLADVADESVAGDTATVACACRKNRPGHLRSSAPADTGAQAAVILVSAGPGDDDDDDGGGDIRS